MAGHYAMPGVTPYDTAKFAVVGLSEGMRHDLAPFGIGVSVLCPGMVSTRVFESERNRPDGLRSQPPKPTDNYRGSLAPSVRALLRRLVGEFLEPDVVGEMVLHAIRENEFYVFTHPAFKELTDLRHAEIDAAFARWSEYRVTRGIR
jgi:NAD(P)-dependent dehydrogenase (short-subunit alcohol dehydrogenase family)